MEQDVPCLCQIKISSVVFLLVETSVHAVCFHLSLRLILHRGFGSVDVTVLTWLHDIKSQSSARLS